MSYDLYFWPAGQDDPDDVMDGLDAITPDPAVLAFRREILGLHPDLAEVCDPAQEDSAAASKYVVLNLPFGWMETVLPGVLEAAVRHGLSGWDPQMGEVPSPENLEPGEVRYLTEEEAFPYGRGQVAIDRRWAAEELRDRRNSSTIRSTMCTLMSPGSPTHWPHFPVLKGDSRCVTHSRSGRDRR